MNSDNKSNNYKKPDVDEDYLMNIISGDETLSQTEGKNYDNKKSQSKSKQNSKNNTSKKFNYEETFLHNQYHSARNGKVVYIRSEYHERLLRMVQLTKEDKITLYSYIDNILAHHFKEFGEEITDYFNQHFKPII